jgi:carbon-monoxide dehydrogenase large subunit
VGVRGVPTRLVTLRDLARAAGPQWDHGRPPGVEAGLEATYYYEAPTVTWAYATHAVIVEVDPDTGSVTVEKYVIVHDAGVLVNPTLAEAQVVGGAAQGLGAALFEDLAYDGHGQLLTGTFMDYAVPTAAQLPAFEVVHQQIPSPLNPFGCKGLGEGGAIAPPAAIANAVCDALAPFGAVEFNQTPVRRAQIVQAVRAGAAPGR